MASNVTAIPDRVTAPLLSVGSLPFTTADATFRACGSTLGPYLPALSDGEVGEQWDWTGYLHRKVFAGNPGLVEEQTGKAQPGVDERIVAGDRETQYDEDYANHRFRIKEGVARLTFDDLYVGGLARTSYESFKQLQAEGVVAPNVRFQVCLPGTASAIESYFDDRADWPEAKRAYEEGVATEVARLTEVIPPSDLAVQFDLCFEIVDMAVGGLMGEALETDEERLARHAASVEALSRAVPGEALLGYHLCYGTWGGWPAVEITDLGLSTRFANAVVAQSARHVDYVHAPVTPDADRAFFSALAGLDIGDTKLYLGIVHPEESGLEGFRRRLALALELVDDVGVAGVCGFGRHELSEAPEIIAALAQCAEELSASRAS